MNQPQNQQPNMHPDEAKAVLGFATHLSEQMMPKDAPQTSETAPEQPQTPQTQETAPPAPQIAPQEDVGVKIKDMEGNLMKKLDDIRKELKADSLREIDGIKQDIKAALNEDDAEEKTTKTSK